MQREVAAALESVFPRVGLKAFVSLAPEEKAGQVRCVCPVFATLFIFMHSVPWLIVAVLLACCIVYPAVTGSSWEPAFAALQLVELAHLILGIRVFNFDIGKGGAGITDIAKASTELLLDLERRLNAQVQRRLVCMTD